MTIISISRAPRNCHIYREYKYDCEPPNDLKFEEYYFVLCWA